ncbi:helix-turn-helix domain-containing protein [Streptomyces capoamus]|uniref:helix-turn-helix domain-containing protein n=1 Tax=Streptomyces capoamus TaxID=68183 RepID=UPI003394EE6A
MTRRCRIPNCTRNAAPHRLICWTHKNRLYRNQDPHLKLRNITHPEDIPPVVEDRLPDHGLTITDRRTAARQLTARGATPEEIAELIGVTPRTIYRWRAQDRARHRQAA